MPLATQLADARTSERCSSATLRGRFPTSAVSRSAATPATAQRPHSAAPDSTRVQPLTRPQPVPLILLPCHRIRLAVEHPRSDLPAIRLDARPVAELACPRHLPLNTHRACASRFASSQAVRTSSSQSILRPTLIAGANRPSCRRVKAARCARRAPVRSSRCGPAVTIARNRSAKMGVGFSLGSRWLPGDGGR